MADIPEYQQIPGQGRKREFDSGPGMAPSGEFGKKPRFDFQGGAGGGGGGEGEDPTVPATLRVLIRNSDAGGIIGKGGDNIKRLRKNYDCQVVLPDSAGAPERVMTIMGSIPNCVKVLEDVLNGLASDYRSSQPGEGDKEVQILIPQPFMGTIIGTGGTKIKDLRMRTKCNVKIFSDPMPGSNERSIQLVGSQAQISECVEHFLDDIGKKEPREPIFLYEPANQFGGGPPDMGGGFPPFRGRGGRGGPPSFRGGRGGGRGRGGEMGGNGGWRGGRGGGRGAPGGGSPGGNMRGGGGGGGRGGSYNGSGNTGYQFGSGPPRAPAPSQYPGQSQASNSVGYGSSNQPSVGYTAQQPPAGAPPSMGVAPPSSYPPAQPPPSGAPVQYPHQGPPPSQGYSGPNAGGTGGSGSQSQQVTIPAEYTDAILGPNGSNLQHIKGQSSCDITLEPPKPGVNERVITIVGSASGIQYAQQLMQNSVRQHHPNI